MEPHPIRLVVADDLKRSRLTVFFRLLLAIPHLLWLMLWGIAVYLAWIVSWFATLFAGQTPQGLHSFLAGYLRYSTRVSAYMNLVADPFPSFGASGSYPVDAEIADPDRQSRWTTFFRIVLAIPAFILTYVLQQVMQIVGFLGWFVSLALGRMPEGMRNLSAFCLRYQTQTYGYAMLLTPRYPSLSSGPSA